MTGHAVYRSPASGPGTQAGRDRPRGRRCRYPRLKLPHAADGLIHAAVHREDINQAGGLENPAHGRLRGDQRQVTTVATSPSPYSQQHRQTAVADAL
jgi:hypothetical protein